MSYREPANLITYLPSYYEDNEEIIRLTDAENPEIDSLWDAIKETRDNQFIKTSGDKRIRQWERLLRMRPDYVSQSLDYRKDMVIMRLSTRIPLTYRWLVALLTDLVGTDHFAIDLRHNEYTIEIHLKERPDIGEDLWFHLRRSIPANLGLGFKYTVTNRVKSPFITGLTAADYGDVFIPHPKVLGIHAKEKVFSYTRPEVDKQRTVIPHKRPKDVTVTAGLNVGAASVNDNQLIGIPPRFLSDTKISTALTVGTELTVDSQLTNVPHRLPSDVVVHGGGYIGSGVLEYSWVRIPTKALIPSKTMKGA